MLDFAEKKGMQKGMQKEKEVTARIMKSKGLSLELISECTGLTTEKLKNWNDRNKKATRFPRAAFSVYLISISSFMSISSPCVS